MAINSTKLPLVVQLTAPEKGDIEEFKKTLKTLKNYGLYGVEVNVLDFDEDARLQLKNILDNFGLKMTKLASGKTAMKEGLSLTSSDESVRVKSVGRLKDMIEYASHFEGCGIILGFIKGGPHQDSVRTKKHMIDALNGITAFAEAKKVSIVIEATNHYETSTAITVASAAKIVDELNSDIYKILPDTYHMNIEEVNTSAALQKYIQYYDSIHISDNNRYFPGLGTIDFKEVYTTLKSLGFQGYLGVEGNTVRSVAEDIKITVDLLSHIEKSLNYIKNIEI